MSAQGRSRAPHGARGLKHKIREAIEADEGRAPHGARGLKQLLLAGGHLSMESRPARGAWIETLTPKDERQIARGRAPHGARGLKRDHIELAALRLGRAPHGARGLKHIGESANLYNRCRAPHGARGLKRNGTIENTAAPRRAPHGARGLKPICSRMPSISMLSRPARGAWIETDLFADAIDLDVVAPRTGRVD